MVWPSHTGRFAHGDPDNGLPPHRGTAAQCSYRLTFELTAQQVASGAVRVAKEHRNKDGGMRRVEDAWFQRCLDELEEWGGPTGKEVPGRVDKHGRQHVAGCKRAHLGAHACLPLPHTLPIVPNLVP